MYKYTLPKGVVAWIQVGELTTPVPFYNALAAIPGPLQLEGAPGPVV